MAAPVVGVRPTLAVDSHGNYLIALEQRLARGDRMGILADLRGLERLRRGSWPGSTSVDATYIESWVRASAGDTLGALRQVDETLDGLPSVSNRILTELALTGAILRLMILRVDLSSVTDAHRTRWASAVCELWRSADSALQGERLRMCQLAGPRSYHPQ